MSDYVIDVRDLRKSFGAVKVVDGLSLQVAKGEICGFLGANGSGKTTTIRMLCGLLTADSGRGTCLGFDIIRQASSIRRHVGYMTQKFSFYDDLTVFENLDLVASVYEMSRPREAVHSIMDRMRLADRRDQLAAQLSGGWKQRLALGCAMLHEPKLIFLDEPTAGIDPVARRQLWDLLFELSAHGITFFVTTHYMDEAERCSHVAYIYYGKLIADGTPDSLRELPDVQPPGTYRVEITAPEVTRALRIARTLPGIRSATIFGQSVHALINDDLDLDHLRGLLLKQSIVVAEIRPLAPSLEDVFVELTYKHQSESEATRG